MVYNPTSDKLSRGGFSDFVSRLASAVLKRSEGYVDHNDRRVSGVLQERPFGDGYDRSSALCYADTLYGNMVAVVDPRNNQHDLQGWLAKNCLDTRAVQNLNQVGALISAAVHQIGVVLIDIESCGGVTMVIDDLLAFRRKYPDVPVILISAESEVDDFSTERLAISDVTLRTPVSVSRLDLALAEAQINNQVWQSRSSAAPK